jgi:bacterioferritin
MISLARVDISKYQVNASYPEVKIEKKNKKYAELILDDYASRGSEFTAVTDYIYAHALTENDEIAEIFLGIAIVEMNHLDMLADVIIGFGGNPKFYNGDKDFWKGQYTHYENSTKERIERAIESEKGAIKQYEDHIREIRQNDVKRLLERIIQDEKLHIKIFNHLLDKYYRH